MSQRLQNLRPLPGANDARIGVVIAGIRVLEACLTYHEKAHRGPHSGRDSLMGTVLSSSTRATDRRGIEMSRFARRNRWKTSATALAVAAVLAVSAAPASAATYVWMNKSINPNGTTYTETSTAGQFSRTGITAQISNADGYTWGTTVSYNGYSSSGNAVATQNGPRGYGVTKASFIYKPGPAANEKVNVKAWLLDAKLSGTSKAAPLGLLSDESEIAPPVADITAADLRAGVVDGFNLDFLGSTSAGDLWTGTSDTDFACIFVANDEYVSSSCNPTSVAATEGVSLHALSADHTLQVAYAPSGEIDPLSAAAVGFSSLSSEVAINVGPPVEGTLQIDAGAHARSPHALGSVAIPLAIVQG